MTATGLHKAALGRKSVIGSNHLGCGHRPMPAAFVIGMPFIHVVNHLRELKVYKPKSNLNETKPTE